MNRNSDIKSAAAAIEAEVSSMPEGAVFFSSDLETDATEATIWKALSNMEKRGVTVRLAKGIYARPKHHHLVGQVLPTADQVAAAIARRDRATIIPTGALALNRLGISTQVVMRFNYLTDGSPREVKLERTSISFRKKSPKLLAMTGPISTLIVLAMQEVGKNGMTPEILKKLCSALEREDPETAAHDLKLAPVWMRMTLKACTNRDQKEEQQ